MKASDIFESAGKPDLTPMIDVVFLMLVFFMVTTELVKQEADLGIQLPSQAAPTSTPELPSKHTIDILPDGTVLLNGGDLGEDPYGDLSGLTSMLAGLKASADRLQKQTIVTIQADAFSPHYRSIDVLNACSRAKLKYVSFSQM
ncbi:biopolymer transporter ExbD [Coraliomargarita sp. SDUM461003]|uniref:Biopolymer transporter ExbD n=1 Tax=Thalassobacterium maritimum TaxID=3041265 RepID=A0ABU1ATP9_9BACT|nr:biopolymer transporter ExbD [Coraliomargarita sp. SDUM461003]MDQ8207538.1 biopolymer transporter ExbD [Coraliomargarita sp. SDUM461003]